MRFCLFKFIRVYLDFQFVIVRQVLPHTSVLLKSEPPSTLPGHVPAMKQILYLNLLTTKLYLTIEVLCQDNVCQSDFMNNPRMVDNIFVLNSLSDKQKMKNAPLYVHFVDFSKEFYCVDNVFLL